MKIGNSIFHRKVHKKHATERFIEKIKVNPTTGCWEWQGSLFGSMEKKSVRPKLPKSDAGLACCAPFMGEGLPISGEMDDTMQGILIRLMWGKPYGGTSGHRQRFGSGAQDGYCWCVALPDWENRGPNWFPGQALPWRYVSLSDFLWELEIECKLRPVDGEEKA